MSSDRAYPTLFPAVPAFKPPVPKNFRLFRAAVGDLTDNPDLKREGKTDRATGKVKEKLSDTKERLEDVVDDVKDKLHRD